MKLADIKPNPDNPRTISEEKLDKLANSIKDFPKMMVQRPMVVKDGIIIGGNMRYRAIEKLGMTEIPDNWVSNADDYTEAERRRFIMQDNTAGGENDWDMVANEYEVEELEAWGVDLPKHMQVEDEVEEDEAPEVSSEPPVSQLGSIYQLGRHRVMCGDSTDMTLLGELMQNQEADMVLTDPPYNIGLEYHGYDDKKDAEVFENSVKDCFKNAMDVLKSRSHFTFTYKVKGIPEMLRWCEEIGLEFRHIAIWHNPQRKAGSFPGMWGYGYEPIMNFSKDGWKNLNNKNGVGYSDVYIEDSPIKTKKGNDQYHPAEKPLKVWAEIIKLMSAKDDLVLDVYLGSGSTLIACEQTGRTCYGMELDPKYVDVIRKRYAKFVSPDDWETEWQNLTPVVERELSEAKNG